MKQPFVKGDRIVPSEQAISCFRRLAKRRGICVGHQRDNLVRVVWDGMKTPQTFHVDFIDHAKPEGQ